MSGPLEGKVLAAALGVACAEVLIWVIGGVVEVPEPVAGLIMVAVPSWTALACGWFARHTPRPDLDPAPEDDDLT